MLKPERTNPLRHPVASVQKELGVVPTNGPNGSMTGLSELKENLDRDRVRHPSYTAYPLKAVNLCTDMIVNRVTSPNQKAMGVELNDGRASHAKKEAILCVGAYCNPQLLMLSGIGPENPSANGIPIIRDSPGVGRNLFVHFAVYMAFRLRDPADNLALRSPSWIKPSPFKGLPHGWAVSRRLPQEVSKNYTNNAAVTERNLFPVLTVYTLPGIPGIPIDRTHIATTMMLLLPTS
ncbi:GMC oxidoreductase [Karstenula rhodostoma CBS 690.94]|uniref:GMC oxidoreductase n=1 Tax=Karstenula rhodostoma CBS 690.94 TaxID=1392251 RepID=A0A9P4P6E8_9PLEO|nr:GMC oxidoreductase [Karstenula rhodostoma CBS 690.94]